MKESVFQTIKQTSFSILNNKIDSIRRKNISKTGCRVMENGKIGVAGAIGEISENELYIRAKKLLAFGIEYEVEPTADLTNHTRITKLNMDDETFVKSLEKILGEINKQHPDFAVSNRASLTSIKHSLTNDKNLDLVYEDCYLSLGLLLKAKSSANIIDCFYSSIERELNIDKAIAETCQTIEAFKNQVDLPTEQTPVIISQGLLTRLFQRDLNGKIMGNGASLFQNRIGEKIFADNFSLYIERDPLESYSSPFDTEGTIVSNEHSFLIKDGAIIRPYTDKRTAKRYNFDNTGCASGAYDSVPSLGSANLEIAHSDRTLKQLLNGRLGVFVSMASGGDFTPDGQFATPVQVAFLTDGEKLLGKLPELTIKGQITDFFGADFVGVSSNKFFNERLAVTLMNIERL